MKKLLLSLLLCSTTAVAAPGDVEVFTASAHGSLTIGADGSVQDVELDSHASLGEGILDGYEQRVRQWRFEPVLESGTPVVAKARVHLSLAATRTKGTPGARFTIRRARFLDASGESHAGWGTRPAHPVYPAIALREGVGAQVVVMVQLDAQGRPAKVAAEQLELLGVPAGRSNLGRLAGQFRSSAEQVAAKWTFQGQREGDVLRVPIRYRPGGMAGGWVLTVVQPVELPEWAAQERERQQAVELGYDGVATAARFKLLTPLDGT